MPLAFPEATAALVARAAMVAMAKVGGMGKAIIMTAVANLHLHACKPPGLMTDARRTQCRGRLVEMRAAAAVAGGGQMAVMPQTYRSLRHWVLVAASGLGG